MSEPQEVFDILDGLTTPTADEVYTDVREYDTRDVLAAVGATAKAGGGGGGSQPWEVHDFRFTEQPTAGTYIATLDIPAGTTVAQLAVIIEQALVPGQFSWGAATAELTIGDSVNVDGYTSAFSFGSAAGANTTVLDFLNDPSQAIDGGGFYGILTLNGVYTPNGAAASALNFIGEGGQGLIVYPADDTITMTMVASGGFPVAWAQNHSYAGNAIVIAAGHAWRNEGSPGTSGGSAPDFAGNLGGTVVDNDITWTDYGAATAGGITLVRIWTIAGVTATDATFA